MSFLLKKVVNGLKIHCFHNSSQVRLGFMSLPTVKDVLYVQRLTKQLLFVDNAMAKGIGAGASKFLVVRRNVVRISPNFPEKYCAPNMKHSRGLQFISSDAIFLEKVVKFRRIWFSLICKCRNICARIFCYFARIFRFARIVDKSKLLGVRLHPLHPSCYTTVKYFVFDNFQHFERQSWR